MGPDDVRRIERLFESIRDELRLIRKALEQANEPPDPVLALREPDEHECPECDPEFHPFGSEPGDPQPVRPDPGQRSS